MGIAPPLVDNQQIVISVKSSTTTNNSSNNGGGGGSVVVVSNNEKSNNKNNNSDSYRLQNEFFNEITLTETIPFEATGKSLYDNLSWFRKFFLCIDNILVGGCYHKYDQVMDKGLSYNFLSSGGQTTTTTTTEDVDTIINVDVEVRATIVSFDTTNNNNNNDKDCLNNTTTIAKATLSRADASNFVGIVKRSTDTTAFKVGTPVTSLIKCSVDSSHVNIPPQLLIPIPKNLDAGEAVTLVSMYLPAFGALHHGSHFRRRRFCSDVFKGMNILITDGGTNESDAIVKLSLMGGASKVFVLMPVRRKKRYHVGSHNVLTLSDEPRKWLSRVKEQGEIDIIIDLSYPKNYDLLKSCLATSSSTTSTTTEAETETAGRYVVVVPSSRNDDNLFKSFLRTVHFAAHGVLLYDFEEMCENCYEDIVDDLGYLFRKLERRKIRPWIDKYIKSRDVSFWKEDMKQHPVIGAVVCEPWRRSQI